MNLFPSQARRPAQLLWNCAALMITIFSSSSLPATNTSELNVTEHGVNGDGTDETLAIQAVFDKAKIAGNGVFFPSGRYVVSQTINACVPNIRGRGHPILEAKDGVGTFDLIYADVHEIRIEGMWFRGGRDQLSIGNKNIDQSRFYVGDCNFKGAGGFAINLRKGSDSSIAIIENSRFTECEQVLFNSCDTTVFSNSWVTSSIGMKDKAVIVNIDVLTCENILGVPLVNGQNQRWIDNYKYLTCRNFRFGGEGGGFTPVVNFRKYSNQLTGLGVILESCQINALGSGAKACAVYAEEMPNALVIRDCAIAGIPPVKVSPKIDLKTYFDGTPDGLLRYDFSGNILDQEYFQGNSILEAVAGRKKERDYGNTILPIEETDAALAKAVSYAKKLPEQPFGEAKRGDQIGRRQKKSPDDYIDLGPTHYRWDLEDRMDGTTEKNSSYLALGQAGDDVILLRRQDEGFPHVLVRDVVLDLSKTPWLVWRNKDAGVRGRGFAVRVIDKATGQSRLLCEYYWGPFYEYDAYDLRKAFGYTSGSHTFDIKFYFLGIDFEDGSAAADAGVAKRGDYMIIDYLRAEKE